MIIVRCDRDLWRCGRCREPLAVGTVIVQNDVGRDDPEKPQLRFHPRCAVDVSPYYARFSLEYTTLEFDGRAALLELANARWNAIEAARKKGSPRPVIEPATDPWGRPRVTVLIAGSAMDQRAWGRFGARVSLATWRSTVREYVFAWSGQRVPFEDPSQPVVAAVYAANVSVKLVRSQREKIEQWKALALPTPVLWLFGEDATPEREAYLRAQIDLAGYVGDACAIVRAPLEDPYGERSMDTLVAALDEASAR
jgi:hypothetical protein